MGKSYKNQNLKVVQYIIDQELKDSDYCELPKQQQDVEHSFKLWFYSGKYNTRLTHMGRWYMKRWFKANTIELTHKSPTIPKSDHIFWLAKNMNTPFYISYKGKFIEIFNDEDAIELIMLNGDLDHYVRIYK